jgi:hypothetical protein
MDTFHGLIIKNKKAMGACPAHPWLSLYSARLEAWVNPPKAKKEKIFVGPGHHIL